MANEQECPRGAILQRDKETYAIVPRFAPAGVMDAAVFRRLADVIEKYGIPVAKITSAQRIALVGIKPEDVEAIWADLGVGPAPATGHCVHYVQACPGNAFCRFGQQDSLGLGARLDKLLVGYGEFAHKVKIGLSGCTFNCGESWLRDFGAFGKPKGWTVIAGGTSGGRPRIGDEMARDVDGETVVALARKALDLYGELAKRGERLGRTIERVGVEVFRARLLD
ncbi:MAG: NAD(P)/FAD-dependent oxidoreductase [Bacillota bacterium]